MGGRASALAHVCTGREADRRTGGRVQGAEQANEWTRAGMLGGRADSGQTSE